MSTSEAVQQLLDRRSIEDVLILYSHCVDAQQVDRLVDEVYAPDGVDDHGQGDVVGREALRAWFEEVLGHLAASAQQPNGESIIGLGELPRTQKGAHALADRLGKASKPACR